MEVGEDRHSGPSLDWGRENVELALMNRALGWDEAKRRSRNGWRGGTAFQGDKASPFGQPISSAEGRRWRNQEGCEGLPQSKR